MWRSDPQIPPRVIRTRAASGSTSGTVYSRMSKSALNFVMTARRPFMRASPFGSWSALGVHQVRLGGGDPRTEGHRSTEALEGHLHPGQAGEELQLVETAEVADPEHLAFDVTEPDPERQVERTIRVGDVGVRVEAG